MENGFWAILTVWRNFNSLGRSGGRGWGGFGPGASRPGGGPAAMSGSACIAPAGAPGDDALWELRTFACVACRNWASGWRRECTGSRVRGRCTAYSGGVLLQFGRLSSWDGVASAVHFNTGATRCPEGRLGVGFVYGIACNAVRSLVHFATALIHDATRTHCGSLDLECTEGTRRCWRRRCGWRRYIYPLHAAERIGLSGRTLPLLLTLGRWLPNLLGRFFAYHSRRRILL